MPAPSNPAASNPAPSRPAMPPADPPRYGRVARILHWVVAVLVIGAVAAGLTMVRIGDGPLQNGLFDNHRAVGFVVLVLVVLRLVWRLGNRPPKLTAAIPFWQRAAAAVVHWSLYALLILTPLVGWIATNAYGAPIGIFGLFELPVLVAKDEALSKVLFGLHETLGLVIAGLVGLHVAAALYHQFVRKDGLIGRMWPI